MTIKQLEECGLRELEFSDKLAGLLHDLNFKLTLSPFEGDLELLEEFQEVVESLQAEGL